MKFVYRFEINVRAITATTWIPSDHLIVKQTLTDSLLLSKIRKILPQKPDLELFDTYSSFVTVTELHFDTGIDTVEKDKIEEDKDEKEENSTTGIRNKINKQEKKENDGKNTKQNITRNSTSTSTSSKNVPIPVGGAIRIDWSDGSHATVDGSNGKLLR